MVARRERLTWDIYPLVFILMVAGWNGQLSRVGLKPEVINWSMIANLGNLFPVLERATLPRVI
jgi:hypothetical protein